jgi:hypothetical protein
VQYYVKDGNILFLLQDYLQEGNKAFTLYSRIFYSIAVAK